jgi:hypothetical protein
MTLSPLESQLLASAVLVIPAIAILLYAVFSGQFARNEDAKYVVFTAEDNDYWEEDARRRALPREDRKLDRKKGGE